MYIQTTVKNESPPRKEGTEPAGPVLGDNRAKILSSISSQVREEGTPGVTNV